MSDAWQRLALLGTTRGEVPVPAPDPLLEAPFAALDWSDRETAFLTAASLLAVARSAGAPLLRGAVTPSPCPPEPRPEVPRRAADLLPVLLAGVHPACVREWLEIAAQRGFVVAPRYLPALFAHGTEHTHQRSAIGRVLGARGLWLASVGEAPPWVCQRAPVAIDAWNTGTLDERVGWLRTAAERDPPAAAEALVATWGEESGDAREALLRALVRRPHPSLASWLEKVPLRDRRGAIRELARTALANLPGCAFLQRAIVRATSLLAVEGDAEKRIVIALPEAFDPAWRDDGIEEKPPAGVGKRAFWAQKILALVPVTHWLARFGVDARTFLEWNRDDASAELFATALVAGQRLAPTPEVALALAEALLVVDRWPRAAGERREFVSSWLLALPRPASNAVATRLLELEPEGELTVSLLQWVQFSSPEHLAVCMSGIHKALDAPYRTAEEGELLAASLPSAMIDLAERSVGARASLTAASEAFLRTLELRTSVLAAFDAVPAP